MRTHLRRLPVLALALVLAAACAPGQPGSPDPSPTVMSDAEILTIGKELAQCIRNNGVPDFPDPYVDRGRLQLPEGSEDQMEAKYPQQVLDQALQSCQPIMYRLPESAIKGESESQEDDEGIPGPEDVEALRKFAQCIRENGIPDWPDPKSDGSVPLRGTPLEGEGKSPRTVAAYQACSKHWSGKISFS
jgi:hypothetical protein